MRRGAPAGLAVAAVATVAALVALLPPALGDIVFRVPEVVVS